MDNGVNGVAVDVLVKQVEQTVARKVFFSVVNNCKACIQESVVFHHRRNIVADVVVVFKNAAVGPEYHQCAIGFVGVGNFFVVNNYPLAEFNFLDFPFAYRFYHKIGRKGIHRFNTHAIKPNRFFKNLRVVFGAGVHSRSYINQFPKGNAAAKVTNNNFFIGNGHFNFPPVSHHEFIDGVVDNFF